MLPGHINIIETDQSYTFQPDLAEKASGTYSLPLPLRKNMYPPCRQCHLYKNFTDSLPDGITFIGSGNFHYLSYFLIQKAKNPFALILLDHHSDGLPSDFLHCGNWVAKAVEDIPFLRQVIMIGINDRYPNLLRNQAFSHQITSIPISELKDSYLEKIEKAIPDLPLYISIDKDVLDKESAKTDWDQGKLTLYQLTEILKLLNKREIVGVDICGESPLSDKPNTHSINQTANITIISAFKDKKIIPLRIEQVEDDGGFFPEKSA